LPSVATMAGRSPACTQDRRVELRWPCSARTGSETLNPQHPVGGTDAHSDRWAYTSCHGLAAAPSCPTGGRPPLVAGPRTGASTRHPRLLQPGRRPQRLSVSSEVLHVTRAADQEDRGIRGRTSGDPLLAILQRYVEPSQAADATDSCSPDSPRRRCPTQPTTRPAAATGSGLGLSAFGNVRPRRAQVEQDDRQRRDAQEQVKEVLGGEVGRWCCLAVGGRVQPVRFPCRCVVSGSPWRRSTSGPLSNRACSSSAHGFPTSFTAAHTPPRSALVR
jgi:hypothetical protein